MNDNQKTEIKVLSEKLKNNYISDFAHESGISVPYSEDLKMYHHRLELFSMIPEVRETKKFIETIPESIYRLLRAMIADIVKFIFEDEKDIILYRYIYQLGEMKKIFKKEQVISETYNHIDFPKDDVIQGDFLIGTAHVKIDHIRQLSRVGILSATSIHGPEIDSDMMLYNYNQGILLHIYDDRGCDVFFKNKADFDNFYKEFKENIDYYNDWPNRYKEDD